MICSGVLVSVFSGLLFSLNYALDVWLWFNRGDLGPFGFLLFSFELCGTVVVAPMICSGVLVSVFSGLLFSLNYALDVWLWFNRGDLGPFGFLLFSFELCSRYGSETPSSTGHSYLAIFFWIMPTRISYCGCCCSCSTACLAIFFWIMPRAWASSCVIVDSTILLFSFELCSDSFFSFGLQQNTPTLLFSFELCQTFWYATTLTRQCCRLAIFFWIMRTSEKVWKQQYRQQPCYFLLNYAGCVIGYCGCCKGRDLLFSFELCTNLETVMVTTWFSTVFGPRLAIFFWIMRWPVLALRMLWASRLLLFSFELCFSGHLATNHMSSDSALLFSFELCLMLGEMHNSFWRAWNLLFSFELCVTGLLKRLHHPISCWPLLFSFELCAGSICISNVTYQLSCYFLLNYAFSC